MSNRIKPRVAVPKVNPDDKVMLGYLHPGTVDAEFMRSVINMQAYDATHNGRLWSGGGLISFRAGANLSGFRNDMVEAFKANKLANWLLMVDSDMTFQPDALDRLMSRADPELRPIVGGLCFGLDGQGDFHSPTLYYIFEDEKQPGKPVVARARQFEDDKLEKVAGTGAAFLLIHRSVFEKFDSFTDGTEASGFNKAYPYFQETEYYGQRIGEDLTFCFRAGMLGIPVYVDTGCHIGHVKSRELTYDTFRAQFGKVNDDQPNAA